MNIKFYFLSTLLFSALAYLGFELGFYGIVNYAIVRLGLSGFIGLEAFSLAVLGLIVGLITSASGLVVALIILHKLSKKYFPGVAFLRTTFLAFFTFLFLLFLYLLLGLG